MQYFHSQDLANKSMMMRMLLGSARKRTFHTFISKETIRPSSPTPPHLKTYNLSLIDQFNPSIYMPVVFFYPNRYPASCTGSQQAKAAQLKQSLSQTLTQCYPLAGSYVAAEDGAYVDCNDEGVDFLEVRSDQSLTKPVCLRELDKFFPTDMASAWLPPSKDWSSLMKVQFTYFSCGGIALAVSMSHKIGDGSTFFTFMNHWASITRGNSCKDYKVEPLPPHFVSSSKANVSPLQEVVFGGGNSCVTKKFVFPNSKLALLKANVKEEMITINPTRVEVLSSLLYASAVRSSKADSRNPAGGHVLLQAVNMRKRMAQPLPDNYMGNMVAFIYIQTMNESELALNSLITRTKDAKTRLMGVTESQMKQPLNQIAEVFVRASKNELEFYLFTSLCGIGAYDVNFGWGKPIQATLPGSPAKNCFLLMDNASREGIEALVTLEEEDMAIFQNDDQLLAYSI